jgi:hypothetical protein
MRELGAATARLLFERIAGEEPAAAVLASDVVIRASCGCEPLSDEEEESHR